MIITASAIDSAGKELERLDGILSEDITCATLFTAQNLFYNTEMAEDQIVNMCPSVEDLTEFIQGRNSLARFIISDDYDAFNLIAAAMLDETYFKIVTTIAGVPINEEFNKDNFNEVKVIGLIYCTLSRSNSIFNISSGSENYPFLTKVSMVLNDPATHSIFESDAFKAAAYDTFTNMTNGPAYIVGGTRYFNNEMFKVIVKVCVTVEEDGSVRSRDNSDGMQFGLNEKNEVTMSPAKYQGAKK